MLNSIKKLLCYSLIGGLISAPTVVLSNDYNAEMKSNQKSANAESKEITHQHKLLESDISATAKGEHKDVTNTTNQKLDQVRQTYANSKDRSTATKKIKQTANNFHKEIDSRKKKHLAASADLKQSHLQESSDRHDRQANQIKAAYGKTGKAKKTKVKATKAEAAAPTTGNADSLQVRSQRNAQRRARQACRANREENEQVEQAQQEQRKAEKKQALADQRAAKKAASDAKKADRDAKKAADKARAKADREAKANKAKAKKSNKAVDSYGDNY